MQLQYIKQKITSYFGSALQC